MKSRLLLTEQDSREVYYKINFLVFFFFKLMFSIFIRSIYLPHNQSHIIYSVLYNTEGLPPSFYHTANLLIHIDLHAHSECKCDNQLCGFIVLVISSYTNDMVCKQGKVAWGGGGVGLS